MIRGASGLKQNGPSSGDELGSDHGGESSRDPLPDLLKLGVLIAYIFEPRGFEGPRD
jgi:hypothetical protein